MEVCVCGCVCAPRAVDGSVCLWVCLRTASSGWKCVSMGVSAHRVQSMEVCVCGRVCFSHGKNTHTQTQGAKQTPWAKLAKNDPQTTQIITKFNPFLAPPKIRFSHVSVETGLRIKERVGNDSNPRGVSGVQPKRPNQETQMNFISLFRVRCEPSSPEVSDTPNYLSATCPQK